MSIRRLALAVIALSACTPRLVAMHNVTQTAPLVRVSLDEVDDDLFEFTVVNYTNETLFVDRNAVRVQLDGEVRERRPGGWKSQYAIPPGGAHALFVRFDLKGLQRGTTAAVCFDETFAVAGQPIAVPPMLFVAR